MLARVGGGNSGIKAYLEEGRKADRHFHRDELDVREPLHGDLNLTDEIISSIPDKGQERYIHITLSFKEGEITTDKVREVTSQFVNDSMAAYKSEEYNYYAELHRPRVKQLYNTESDMMEERLNHVHIVIPKKNLESNGRLNPYGKYNSNIKYVEAIQEGINNDHKLASPKDNPRDTVNNKLMALGKYKEELGDVKTKAGKLKAELADVAKGKDYNGFKLLLSERGEVKVRNEGKSNEYLAFKKDGDKQFTNLREPVFKKEFLDNGKIEKPSPKNIERNVQEWKDVRSKEIKYVSDASKGIRAEYREQKTLEEKKAYLAKRADHFYQKHEAVTDKERSNVDITGKGNNQRSIDNAGKSRQPPSTNRVHSLQSLHKRPLVHQQRRTLRVLQGNEHSHIYAESEGANHAVRLRRTAPGAGRGGLSSPIDSYTAKEKYYGSIKGYNSIDAQRVTDFCQKTYLVKEFEAQPTINAKGEPRIKVGNRSYSNSDYLTKHIGLDWPAAKDVLQKLSVDQRAGIPIDKISDKQLAESWRDHSKNYADKSIEIKASERKINKEFKDSKLAIIDQYKESRRSINSFDVPKDRRAFLQSVVVYNKMVQLEDIEEKRENSIKEARNSIRPYYIDINQGSEQMKNLEKLKENIRSKFNKQDDEQSFNKEVNAIRANPESDAENKMDSKSVVDRALKKARENVREETDYSKYKIKDLEPVEVKGGADFKLKDTGETVFRDNGKHVSFKADMDDKDKISVGLDYSINRYGNNLDIRGTKEFKQSVVDVAAEKNLDIKFADSQMNDQLKARKAEIALENSKNTVASSESSNKANIKDHFFDSLDKNEEKAYMMLEKADSQLKEISKTKDKESDSNANEREKEGVIEKAKQAGVDLKEIPESAAKSEKLIQSYMEGINERIDRINIVKNLDVAKNADQSGKGEIAKANNDGQSLNKLSVKHSESLDTVDAYLKGLNEWEKNNPNASPVDRMVINTFRDEASEAKDKLHNENLKNSSKDSANGLDKNQDYGM